MADKTDSNVINGEVIVPSLAAAASAAGQQARHDAEERAAAEANIHRLMAATSNDQSLSSEERSARLSALQGALTSGNIGRMQLAVANYGNTTSKTGDAQAVNFQAAIDDPSMLRDVYPTGGYKYDELPMRFIRKQLDFGMENSSMMKGLAAEVQSLKPEHRTAAEIQIGKNFADWQVLKGRKEFLDAYGPELAQLVDDYKLMRDPKFSEFITKAQEGADKGDMYRLAAQYIAKQVQIADPVGKDLLPKLDEKTQAFFETSYGKPVNMSAVLRDLHKTSHTDRNEALQAYMANGEDIDKLPEHQRKTVRLMKIGVAIDATQNLYAVAAIGKDIAKLELLTDKAHDVSGEKRVALLNTYMLENGMLTTDPLGRRAMAQNIIELIDKDPEAKKLLAAGDIKGLEKKLEAEKMETTGLRELAGAYQDAYTKDTLPDYLKKRISAEDRIVEGDQWKKIALDAEKQRMLEANADIITAETTDDFMKRYAAHREQEDAVKLAAAKGEPAVTTVGDAGQATPVTPAEGVATPVASQPESAAELAARTIGMNLGASGVVTDGKHLPAGGHPPAAIVATVLQPTSSEGLNY